MIALGIETSCDETALSLIEADLALTHADNLRESAFAPARIRVLSDKTLSQIELHKPFGGVFPMMAKREHSRSLIPLLKSVLQEAGRTDPRFSRSAAVAGLGMIHDSGIEKPAPHVSTHQLTNIQTILKREPELLKDFLTYIPTCERPPIDVIAVTEGPGLEPCLWTGINFAKALSAIWNIPVVPVNHMEGHIFSALLRRENTKTSTFSFLPVTFPALALLISGGHTELVFIRDRFDYRIVGETRDDAVGEAFDKVARLLGLPYPGGPEISTLAERARTDAHGTLTDTGNISLPRPMIHSVDFDFSFSGLKTAVLYLLKKIGGPNEKTRLLIAREFEDAVTEVLIAKTKKALETFGAKTLLIGGGVIANTHIRRSFEALATKMGIPLHIPEPCLTTDNALMIAVAGFMRSSTKDGSVRPYPQELAAKGNMRVDEN